MAEVIATVVPSPVVASDQDTDIQVIYNVNGGANIMLDAGAPGSLTNPTFTLNEGDTYNVWQIDLNIVGASAASPVLSGTVPVLGPAPPTSVPQTPGTPSISFAPAPAP